MTVYQFILNGTIASMQDRLTKLQEIGAPSIMITSQEALIKEAQAGTLKISGDTEALQEEYKTHEIRKGRGGKQYLHINGNINYFPNAQYGRYIKYQEV